MRGNEDEELVYLFANLDKNNAHLIEDLILKINDVTLIVISHTFSEEKLKEFDKIYSL